MSKTMWTPGPWHYRTYDQSVGSVDDANGDAVAQSQPRPNNDSMLGNPERIANARLISAAPELYEALEHSMQFVLAWIYEYRDKTDEHSRGQLKLAHTARDKIASALAKARGEQ